MRSRCPCLRCTKHEGERGLKCGSLRHIHARSGRGFAAAPLLISRERAMRCGWDAGRAAGPARRNLAGIV